MAAGGAHRKRDKGRSHAAG